MDQPRRRLSAVWFADIVGYTALSSHDEPAALRLVSALQAKARTIVEQEFEGRIVKFIGDAVLAEFTSTQSAVRAAVSLQERYIAEAQELGLSSQLRIGVHLGEVTATPDGDLYGDGINTAARLQHEAAPGQVIISEDVWRQLRQRPEFRFQSLGSVELRGITTRVEIFDVLFGTRAALARPAPPPSHDERVVATRRRTMIMVALTLIGAGALAAVIVPRYAGRVDSNTRVSNASSQPAAVTGEGRTASVPPPPLPDRNAESATKEPQSATVPPAAGRASPETVRGMPMRGRPGTDSVPGRRGPPFGMGRAGHAGLAPDEVMEIRTFLGRFSAALSAENPIPELRRLYPDLPAPQAHLFAGLRQQFGSDLQTRFVRFEHRGTEGDTLNLWFLVTASSSTRQPTPLIFVARVVRAPGGLRFVEITRTGPQRGK